MTKFSESAGCRARIGFFDSGHGGLDLLREALSRELNADFYYFADLDYMPYGNKEDDLVSARCSKIISHFVDLNCEAVVMACNTATAISIDDSRAVHGIPIVGVEPYINYVNKNESAAKVAGRVGAIVTPMTLASTRLKDLRAKLDPNGEVGVYSMPGLAKAIEELISERDWVSFTVKAKECLSKVPAKISTLVLGCTHYPLIAEFIESELKLDTVSPAKEVIDQLIRVTDCLTHKNDNDVTSTSTFLYARNDELQWQSKTISDFIFW